MGLLGLLGIIFIIVGVKRFFKAELYAKEFFGIGLVLFIIASIALQFTS